MTATTCPICGIGVKNWQERPNGCDKNYYACPNCGRYQIGRSALSSMGNLDKKARAILSHKIWQGQNPDEPFSVFTTTLKAVQQEVLPDPAEQLDRLILWHGQQQESPGKGFGPDRRALRAKVGAINEDDISYLYFAAQEAKLINRDTSDPRAGWRLTMDGWQRYHELQRGSVHSKTAFMAMPFGIDTITDMVNNYFRPAVAGTGFTLKRVDDHTPAGSIDDRMRVEIRMCRFLIADLTYGNQGAYWEAGYAEGLGKHVIYTCEKTFFEAHPSLAYLNKK